MVKSISFPRETARTSSCTDPVGSIVVDRINEEAGDLRAMKNDAVTAGQIETILYSVLPKAIEANDKKVVLACEELLRKYGYSIPNHVSGKWEPREVPGSEVGLRERYASRMPEFGLTIVKSREAFPDWILQDEEGNFIRAEVELRSSHFLEHHHDPNMCDLIVCWEHDTKRVNLPVIEWFMEEMVNGPIVPSQFPLAYDVRQNNRFPAGKGVRSHKIKTRHDELKRTETKRGDATKQVAKEFEIAIGSVHSVLSKVRRWEKIEKRN